MNMKYGASPRQGLKCRLKHTDVIWKQKDLSRLAAIIKPNMKREMCLFCVKKYSVMVYK